MRKPSKQLLSTLSINIKRLRKELDLSQELLANRSGLHRTYIGAIERGERNATLSSLEVLAEALGVNIPTLLTIHDNKSGVLENENPPYELNDEPPT